MKKTLTRIIGATLSLALMVGVGVGVANSKQTVKAEATAGTSASGSWVPIKRASDINTSDDFLLAYAGAENTYYGTGAVSSSALVVNSTLTSGKTIQFESTEGGYFIKISSTKYLNNSSSTSLSSGNSGSSVWVINESDLCVENTSNSNRFLGGIEDGGNIKAYASANKGGYPNVHVYRVAVPADDISLNKPDTTIGVGGTETLTATLDPVNSTSDIVWSSSEEGIATVTQSGVVTGVAAGEATITATANGHSDSCTVTVSIEHGRLQSDPLTVSEAIALGSSLANNAQTTKDYFVGGFVSQTIAVFNEGVAKFWLADGETVIKGFQCYNVTAGVGVDTSDLRVGAEAIIHCNIKKYVNQTTTTIENGSIGEVVSFSYDERPTTEVSLDKDSLNLLPTGSATLKATLTPVYSTEGVVWSSSDEGIATVNQSGVVTAVAVGEATITATSGSFSADCSVNVFRELINLADKSYQVAKPDGSDDFSETTTVSGYTLNLFNSCNNNGSNAYLAFLSKDRTTKNSLASNNTPAPGAITKICFVTTSGASGSAVYEAILSDTEVASVVSNENDKLIGKGSLTIVASALENLRYFAISCTTAGYNGQIEAIYINYETTEESIAHTPTRTALTYTYSNNGSFAYSSAAIRFGGFVPIALWDRLNNESTIQGYGVLLSTPSHLGGDELKDKYNEVDGTNVKKFDTDLEAAGIEHPSSANDAQKGGLVGDYYVWSLYKNITSENLQTEYTAVAYIRTASGVVFFGEVTYSAKTLAADYLNNRGYADDVAEGSLYGLAHFGE